MPALLIIRLLPKKPVDAATFETYLQGLSITAHDASFADPAAEASLLGNADYLAPVLPPTPAPDPTPVPDQNTEITQHFELVPAGVGIFNRQMFSVATAVIEILDAALAPEHKAVDVRLTIMRGAVPIKDQRRYFNARLRPGALPGDPNDFPLMQLGGEPLVSLNVFLPPPGQELSGDLVLPEDGTAPNFATLRTKVEAVLNDDPGNINDIADLTPTLARHVASEITWGEKLPEPEMSLNQIYTGVNGPNSDEERARQIFEGELVTFYVQRDNYAERLAGFVFALSAAIWCEQQSAVSDTAGIVFPIDTLVPDRVTKAGLSGVAASAPFTVPAEYFYAISAVLPLEVSRMRRLETAITTSEQHAVAVFDEALDSEIFAEPAGVDRFQAARRLVGLGLAREPNIVLCPVPGGSDLQTVVQGWLAEPGPDIDLFWTGLNAPQERGHFDLVLCAVTKEHQPLIAAVQAVPLGVANVDDLRNVSEADWLALFTGDAALLPPFTAPGSIADQTAAFLRHLRKFLDAAPAPQAAPPVAASGLPLIDRSPDNLIDRLSSLVPLDLETFDPDTAANAAALDAMFPGDLEGRAAFVAWLGCIRSVLEMAALNLSEPMRFAVVEALWARGFVRPQDLGGFSLEAFSEALVGTVAFDHAAAIFANAAADGAGVPEPVGPFVPVNPFGALTNCLPPKHLSPLGSVGYLQDLLQVSEATTCDDPLPDADATTTAMALVSRRGPLGDLHASNPNACIPIPVIDIVNESLEHMVANGVNHGTIHNSGRDELGGHVLDTNPQPGDAVVHDAETMFAALPEHSTPATPTTAPSAWDTLSSDFSHCLLPYHRPLDIARSYLERLGTSQYDTMRVFRRHITEFVLDPADEPVDFQTHIWRYPVRLPIALDYLCVTPEEHAILFTPGQLGPATLSLHYGFLASEDDWIAQVTMLPVFLERTCLSYCDFLDLTSSGFVRFEVRHRTERELPECEPCCLEEFRIVFLDPADDFIALKRLHIFIRLWRKLNEVAHKTYTFTELADIAEVLVLFNGGTVNGEFIRQFAAFQMLRDDFGLSLNDGASPGPFDTGPDRTHILAFWVDGAAHFDWAVRHLLERIQQYSIDTYKCQCRPPEFLKILSENLDALSALAGFDPATPAETWHFEPTKTLRMAEILAKIYASDFEVGDILFICTPDPQLQGGDPYPAQTDNEARDLPFDVPDNETENGLFALRDALRGVEVADDAAAAWTWERMGAVLNAEFGLPLPPDDDRWPDFGKHFFPAILEAEGIAVAPAERFYEAPLAATSPDMWNTPEGPYRYRLADGTMEATLPIADAAVIAKLARIRQLDASERAAVSALYFAPRAELAFFAFLFENQREAERALVEEPDEAARWAWFQRAFALFYARSHQIGEHVADHIDRISGKPKEDGTETALLLLKHLLADENEALGPWEDDNGAVPLVKWGPRPNGGAFHALLGVVGTGLLAEYRSTSGLLRWREMSGGIDAFGADENDANAPLATLIPSMTTTLTADQLDYVSIRNGFALGNQDGALVGGAEPFLMNWRGLLLIEETGDYAFGAGAPTPDGALPDFEELRRFHRWRVSLKRGQKTWVLLANGIEGEKAPGDCAKPIRLERGFYEIVIEFERLPLFFDGPEDVCPQTTGFQIKYSGPDSGGDWIAVPQDKLFIGTNEGGIDLGFDTGVMSTGGFGVLNARHVVSVRSMRRTMQRLVKAMLFADGFSLGAVPMAEDGRSELGFMLSQPNNFSGWSYFDPGGGFISHQADFNFNLLPVGCNYYPPAAADDSRADPSPQRVAAIFDWWERMFDYSVMRAATARSPEKPVWFLFQQAVEAHVDKAGQLLRHVGIDFRFADLVLNQFDPAEGDRSYTVTSTDLEDERWALRVWRADLWIRALRTVFLEKDIRDAKPFLWASDGPEPDGLENLTRFYRDGCIENDDPHMYKEIQSLNDGLRERGRDALVGYLTCMNRVALPWGGFADAATDLSELLLLDVETGLCQKVARVEEAISAIQQFVGRARLGLEPGFAPLAGFIKGYDRHFSTYRIWQACKNREIYRENWIAWDADVVAQGSEAYRFFKSDLRRSDLTVPQCGGLTYWHPDDLPPHKALTLLQTRESATMTRLIPGRQGLELLGTPDHHARPSWLAPLGNSPGNGRRANPQPTDPIGAAPVPSTVPLTPRGRGDDCNVPMWFEAAVRLGTTFLRIAAAGTPPASTGYAPQINRPAPEICCPDCGKVHPAEMDEYFFWIDISEEFRAVDQVADWVPEGSMVDAQNGLAIESTVWHDPASLPGVLQWLPRRIARLNWCRVHNGEFQTPRRSSEGVELADPQVGPPLTPDLVFGGRTGDSLFFEITQTIAPIGYPPAPSPGYRYDIDTDTATRLPELVAAPPPDQVGGLPAFPFFAWHAPGAPIVPPDRFGAVIAVAHHLATNCRFEDALKWLELCWAPLNGDNIWAECDRPDRPEEPGDPGDDPPDDPGDIPGTPVPVPIIIHPDRPVRPGDCCCPSEPVSDEIARRRHILMVYGETMLAWAEALMRKNAPEAFQQARLLAETVARILGPVPVTVAAEDGNETPQPVSDAILACAPLNPRLMCLYIDSTNLRDRIHACIGAWRTKKGCPDRMTTYFDEDMVRGCWKIYGDICLDEAHWCRVSSPYRFEILFDRALTAANECKTIGAQLLSAYEKGDAEYLAQLRSMHERQIADLTLRIRQDQWRESDFQVQALYLSRQMALTNLNYYRSLIETGLLVGEAQYEPMTGTATGLRAAGNISESIGQAMNLIPDPNVGFPTNFITLPPGKKLAMIFSAAGNIVNVAADIVSTVAGLGLTKDGWVRREDEWQHQVNLFTIEVEQIERQILAAERRRDASLRELNVHRQTMSNLAELHDFQRDKFTNHALYLWLQKETSALHSACYELALNCAWQAEQAYNFERGMTSEHFVPGDAWDSLHEGLLSGERLSLALNRMRASYQDLDRREYEMTKHISLRQHFPTAYLQLIATGRCVVELPEWLFDLDYPGQYMRRIKSLSFSLPCVAGPYTGVHCRVTLMDSHIRTSPNLLEPEHRCCDAVGCNNGYPALPDDNRIAHLYTATEAIATSGGQNDSGLFEVNFRDPRYLPFEYQGAVCRICIELPHENNNFDVDSLSDLVIHMRYTAREGGALLRQAASACAQSRVSGDGVRFIDAKRELGGSWRRVPAPTCFHKKPRGGEAELLGLSLGREMFPFLTSNRLLRVNRIQLLFEAPNAQPGAHHRVIFYGGQRVEDIDPDTCRENVFTIECVGDAAWPGFYHGMLDIDPVLLAGDGRNDLGVLCFGPEIARLCNVWLLFGYEGAGSSAPCAAPEPEMACCDKPGRD